MRGLRLFRRWWSRGTRMRVLRVWSGWITPRRNRFFPSLPGIRIYMVLSLGFTKRGLRTRKRPRRMTIQLLRELLTRIIAFRFRIPKLLLPLTFFLFVWRRKLRRSGTPFYLKGNFRWTIIINFRVLKRLVIRCVRWFLLSSLLGELVSARPIRKGGREKTTS